MGLYWWAMKTLCCHLLVVALLGVSVVCDRPTCVMHADHTVDRHSDTTAHAPKGGDCDHAAQAATTAETRDHCSGNLKVDCLGIDLSPSQRAFDVAEASGGDLFDLAAVELASIGWPATVHNKGPPLAAKPYRANQHTLYLTTQRLRI